MNISNLVHRRGENTFTTFSNAIVRVIRVRLILAALITTDKKQK